jgi:hypothetical protein
MTEIITETYEMNKIFNNNKVFYRNMLYNFGKTYLICIENIELNYIINVSLKILNKYFSNKNNIRFRHYETSLLKLYIFTAFWISYKFIIDDMVDISANTLQKYTGIYYLQFIKTEINMLSIINYRITDYL